MTLASGTRLGPYEILAPLGAGGMGEVYKAKDTRLDRAVAIKVLPEHLAESPERKQRFEREAKAISGLNHPHICTLYDVGEQDGVDFIVMELIEGETLAETLTNGALPLDKVLDYGIQIADGLDKAHRAGIVHRDLKPGNIMLTESGAKLLDFGLATRSPPVTVSGDSISPTRTKPLTQEGALVGTMQYMAPEQLESGNVDGRTDIFAFGAVFFEMLTGERAFHGESPASLIGAILKDEAPLPSEGRPLLPRALDYFLATCLAKDPGERWQSSADIKRQLIGIRDGHGPRRSAFPRRVRDWRVALAAITAVAITGLVIWWSGGSDVPAPPADAQEWFDRGTQALREGTYLTAELALLRAVELHDPYPLAHARLAEAQAELDEMRQALDSLVNARMLLQDARRLDPAEVLYVDGITALVRRSDLGKAVDAYTQLSALHPDRPEVSLDLGRAYEKDNRSEEALAAYDAALALDPQYAPGFLRRGILLGRQGQSSGALESFNEAEELYRALGNFEGVAEVVYQRGSLLNNLERLPEAKAELERALSLATATEHVYQRLRALKQLSTLASAQGRFDDGERYARAAIEHSRGKESLTASAMLDLGYVFFARGSLDETEQYFKEALDIADRFGALRSKARAEASLSSLALSRGDTAEAKRYAALALPYYRDGNYRTETAQVMTILAYVNTVTGALDEAEAAFEELIGLARESGASSQMAIANTGLAELLIHRGHYPEALRRIEESLSVYREQDNQVSVAYLKLYQADVLWRLGRSAQADALLAELGALEGELADQLAGWRELTAARLALSQRHFTAASERARAALVDEAQTLDERVKIAAAVTLCVAEASSDGDGIGPARCAEASNQASELGDLVLLADVLLAQAEARLASGDMSGAIPLAEDALRRSIALGRGPASWQATAVLAVANASIGNTQAARELSSQGDGVLDSLREQWGDAALDGYLSRPDVRYLRERVTRAVSTND